MKDFIFWISIVILFGAACFEGGFIVGKWERFDYAGKLTQHETKIQILQSELRLVKEKVRIP